jgi:hypothetical protein
MTPPLDINGPCPQSCFLLTNSGGVCPAARDVYSLGTDVDRRRAAVALRVAIARDAGTSVGLHELVLLEGRRAGRPLTRPLALLGPRPDPLLKEERKERSHVSA